MSTDSSQSATQEEQLEPCPTPLVWQEVVRSFDTQQTQLDFQTSLGHLKLTSFGEGQPILFIGGHVATPRLFALIAWLLKDEYRCLLMQHPEWTQTPKPGSVIPNTVSMIAEFMERGLPEGVDVFGSSYGAQVALQLLIEHPNRVNNTILQSGWANREFNLIERAVLRVGTGAPGSAGRVPMWLSIQHQNHRRWFPPFDETRFGFLIEEIRQNRTRKASRRLLAAHHTNLNDRLSEINNPVHILRCEGDGPLLDQLQATLEESLPNVTSEEMHTTGQYPYLTHPHRIAKLIRKQFPISKSSETPLF